MRTRIWSGSKQNLIELSLTISVFLLSFFNSSCVTRSAYKKPELPIFLTKYFSVCVEKDGSNSLRLPEFYYSAEYLDFDWQVSKNRDLVLESYSPLGQTVFQVSFSDLNKTFSFNKINSHIFSDLEITQDDFIRVKGFKIPFKMEDVRCFIDFRFPSQWLSFINEYKFDEKKLKIEFNDSFRYWKLEGNRFNEYGWNWKVTFHWYSFFIFGLHELVLEMKNNGEIRISSKDNERFWIEMNKNSQ